MMPDLGKYALPVLGSYAVTVMLLVTLVGLSLWRGARVRARLREVEERQGRANG